MLRGGAPCFNIQSYLKYSVKINLASVDAFLLSWKRKNQMKKVLKYIPWMVLFKDK